MNHIHNVLDRLLMSDRVATAALVLTMIVGAALIIAGFLAELLR